MNSQGDSASRQRQRLIDQRAGQVPTSFWMDGAHDESPPLEESIEADVAIVGGGYTGLSAALAFRAEGLSVALLERDIVGAGASGRNCGQVGAEIGKNLPTLRRHLGVERGRQAAGVLLAAINHLETLIRVHKIECAYKPSGNIFAGIHPSQSRFFERAALTAETLGVPVRLLSDTELRSRGIPSAIACGYQENIGGSLHPGRYVRGLRQAALNAGVQLFEHSPVLGIDDAKLTTVRTGRGRLRSHLCVLGTNAYTPQLGWLRRRLLPVGVSAIVTAPLSAAQKARLGWAGREPIYTAHHVLENLRWTHDDRILVGTKRVQIGFGRRMPRLDDPRASVILESVLRTRFPELHDVPVQRCWSGHVALSPDFLPVFGRTGRCGNILYAAGYGGHGISLASYAGKILTDIFFERDLGPARVLVERRVPPIPPEPLRWAAARTVMSTLMKLDDRLDRRTAARPKSAIA